MIRLLLIFIVVSFIAHVVALFLQLIGITDQLQVMGILAKVFLGIWLFLIFCKCFCFTREKLNELNTIEVT